MSLIIVLVDIVIASRKSVGFIVFVERRIYHTALFVLVPLSRTPVRGVVLFEHLLCGRPNP